jgi:hypothetical protein
MSRLHDAHTLAMRTQVGRENILPVRVQVRTLHHARTDAVASGSAMAQNFRELQMGGPVRLPTSRFVTFR